MLPRMTSARRVALIVLVVTGFACAAMAVDAPRATVVKSDSSGFTAWFDAAEFNAEPTKTSAGEFLNLSWGDASLIGEVGEPAIPVVRRLFVAPPGASVELSVVEGQSTVIDLVKSGLPWRVSPVQLPIEKIPGAKEAAVFQYSESAYQQAPVGSTRATIKELGLSRGQRLFLLEVRPLEYDPAARTITHWPELEVDVQFIGGEAPNLSINPSPNMHRLVLNPDQVPQVGLRGTGNYLIVVASVYESAIASFAAAKTAQGFTVTTYSVPPATTNATIKSYIQSLWGTGNAPDYVLLVGDTNTIPEWTGGGEGSPDTDLNYVCMDGTSTDAWKTPDIAIGRFPVRSTTQLSAIVNKTLYYENGPLADPDYLKRAVFMASTDNYTVSEGTHNWVIANHMDPNGYVSDKLYTQTYNATTQDTRNSFNDGRFFGIYSGHGGTYSWADGPVFSQADVAGLVNQNMYSFVMSFACITGTYTVDECFVETWIREPNKGAIAMYGSSVNSYWTEDDVLEKRLFDSIFDADDAVPAEVGPVWNDTRARYIAEMGDDATTRRYFEMYNLMGDPSIRFPGACSDAGTVTMDKTKYLCADTVEIVVGDCGLNLNDSVVEQVTVDIDSDLETGVEQVVLTETDASSAEFAGSIAISTTDAVGTLLVSAGNTITVTYVDADDGQGGTNVVVVDTALVDCTAPNISNIHAEDIEPRNAVIAFIADEPVRGTVRYGDSCAALNDTSVGGSYGTSPTVSISGLQDSHTYFYSVEAEDEAGNSVLDDNLGSCYSFTTPEVPDFFTELFDASDNDLSNLKLSFTPNGSNDFYFGCIEDDDVTTLPTDPTGGTTLSFSPSMDDGSATINLTGGAQVALYGQSYSVVYPCSNGYLAFVHDDNQRNETLEAHFDGVPKVSALFDDLDPGDGGSVSYKQLADRLAVTWLNVPEYNTTNSNTVQIEMFFDGRITITYLGVAMTDGLAGLSEGEGLDPDFFESDLSGMIACGPQPPMASSGSASTAALTPVTIALQATDDGLPEPPALDFIITDLPSYGSLVDVGDSQTIASVPYTLMGNGNEVEYTPAAGNPGADSFQFMANDGGLPGEGGDSNVATISLTVGGAAWTPVAYDVFATTAISQSRVVSLTANDPNGDPLTYYIKSLPADGVLSDGGVEITTVPFELAGQTVSYHPPCGEVVVGTFDFSVMDATAESNDATVEVTVTVADRRLVYNFPMDVDPGWSTEGLWAFGTPTGGGTHNYDPTSGATGSNVYGYNLNGNYTVNMPEYYLVTTSLDCSSLTDTQLRFKRWLGVERFDRAKIDVSTDGIAWSKVWSNPTTENIEDTAWVNMTYDISSKADGESTVYVRWVMGTTDYSNTRPGWNIDDVEIWGVVPQISGDFNGDGLVNLGDFAIFEGCMSGPNGVVAVDCACIDLDVDADIDMADYMLFQAVLAE